MPNVFKILTNLGPQAAALDPKANKTQKTYFCSLRAVALPIYKEDLANPLSPLGGDIKWNAAKPDPLRDSQPTFARGAIITLGVCCLLLLVLGSASAAPLPAPPPAPPAPLLPTDAYWLIVRGGPGVVTSYAGGTLTVVINKAHIAAGSSDHYWKLPIGTAAWEDRPEQEPSVLKQKSTKRASEFLSKPLKYTA